MVVRASADAAAAVAAAVGDGMFERFAQPLSDCLPLHVVLLAAASSVGPAEPVFLAVDAPIRGAVDSRVVLQYWERHYLDRSSSHDAGQDCNVAVVADVQGRRRAVAAASLPVMGFLCAEHAGSLAAVAE